MFPTRASLISAVTASAAVAGSAGAGVKHAFSVNVSNTGAAGATGVAVRPLPVVNQGLRLQRA
jgi:hypothetical protein